MNKCIQFALSAMIALCLNSFAQTIAPQNAGEMPRHPSFSGASNAQRISSNLSYGNRSAPNPKDSGDPLLLPAVTYGSGAFSGYNMAVADVNGDGKADLLVTNGAAALGGANGAVGVLLGNGDGTFQPAVTYGSGGMQAFAIAVADVNGDGNPDLLVTNSYYSNTVGVLLGNGDGTFQPVITYDSGGGYPWSIAVADVNGDGKPDLVVANSSSCYACTDHGWVSVFLGNGDGTFQTAVSYNSGGYSFFSNVSLAVADVNGDGKPDVAVTSACGDPDCKTNGFVGILLGNGDGSFQPVVTYPSGGRGPSYVAIADVNGDHKPDLLLAIADCGKNICPRGRAAVLLGNGDGTFQPQRVFDSGGYGANSIAVADLNGDGKPDLLLSNGCGLSNGSHCFVPGTSGAVGVLLGNGDGTFQPPVTSSSDGYWVSAFVTAADVNGDGKPDLLAVNLVADSTNNGSVAVLLNNRQELYNPTTTTLTSSANPGSPSTRPLFTATVANQSNGTVTGTVTFQKGSTILASVELVDGQASFRTDFTGTGFHPITASYSGDASNAFSNATLIEVIAAVTKTVLTSSSSPSVAGQEVTFTATLTSRVGPVPDGAHVTFYDEKTVLGSATLSSGAATFTTSSLTAKTHFIQAVYAGSPRFKASTGHVKQVVEK
jgi:Bacterial Ig-like domain (group 3)/FG-GAP-like repeat/FG-GAP repeat